MGGPVMLLHVLGPIFALIGLGYLFARRRWVSEEGLRGLNEFAFKLAMPALLFAGATSPHSGGGVVAVAFFAGCLTTYGLALLLGWRLLRLRLSEAGSFALNCSFGNTNMIGIPVILAVFGQSGLALLLGILALHSLILLPLATVVAELAHSSQASMTRILKPTLLAVLRNPIVLAVLLGLLVTLAGIPVPATARRFLDLVGQAGPPVALFTLGASLLSFNARRDWPEALMGCGLKLAFMPGLVWGAGLALGLGGEALAVAVLTAAMPTGANAFFLARRYMSGAERSGATVLIATLLSTVTLSALLLLLT
ncbi:AEC family transporter [Teichococcus aerofrigidensis]